MNFSIEGSIFSNFDQIRKQPRIWSHELNKGLVKNLIFYLVNHIKIGFFSKLTHTSTLTYLSNEN